MSRNNLLTPVDRPEEPGFVSRLFQMVENLLNGRSRNKGTVTLADGTTATVVDNPLFESHQTITFCPLTANAAAEVPTLWVSARAKGQFTLTHANAVSTDRTFDYVFTG